MDKGLLVGEERFLASPGLANDQHFLKVNLYGIPACRPRTLAEPLLEALSPFGHVAQIRVYLTRKHGIFRGQATALLDTTRVTDPPSLQGVLALGGPFNTSIEVRAEGLPPYCRFCHQEGHLLKACIRRRSANQVANRPPRCIRCGDPTTRTLMSSVHLTLAIC